MSSFGETDLTAYSRPIGKVRVRNLYADSAVYPRMVLSLGVSLGFARSGPTSSESTLEYEWIDVSGELRLAEHDHAVGLLTWAERKRPLKPSQYLHEQQIQLLCEMDASRLEVLERHRNGAAPEFWLQLWPTLAGGNGHLESELRAFRMSVPREKWLQFITGVMGSGFDIVEVQYTSREAERFQRAIARIKHARLQITDGEYDSAVAECRKVLEALSHEVKEEGQKDPLRTLLEQRTDTRRAGEYAGIISKIKQLSGFVHHDFGATLTYTRAEAQFIVRTTESVLSLIGALTTPSTG